MDQHVPGREVPGIDQRQRVGRQVAVAEHRPLGPPRRARGVEQRGEVAVLARHGGEILGRALGGLRQASLPRRVQSQHPRPGLFGGGSQRLGAGRVADEDPRLGIGQEILDLGRGVSGVQRQEHGPGPNDRQIEDDRLDRLFHLHRHAVPRRDAEGGQRIGHAPAAGDQPGMGDARAAGGLDGGGLGVGDAPGDAVENVHGRLRQERSGAFRSGARMQMAWASRGGPVVILTCPPMRIAAPCVLLVRSGGARPGQAHLPGARGPSGRCPLRPGHEAGGTGAMPACATALRSKLKVARQPASRPASAIMWSEKPAPPPR